MNVSNANTHPHDQTRSYINILATGALEVAKAICTLGIFFPALPASGCNTTTDLAYESQNRFSQLVSHRVLPGKQYVYGGRGSCSLRGSFSEAQCKVLVDTLKADLTKKRLLQPQVGGYCLSVKKAIEVCALIKPDAYINYGEACRYIDEHVRALPVDSQGINKLLFELYQILARGKVDDSPSKFRDHEMFISTVATREEIDLNAKNLNAREARIYNTFKTLGERTNQVQFRAVDFTEENQVLKKVGFHRPLQHHHIKDEMAIFVKTLLAQIDEERDPIEIASFAHTEIIRICPFPTENEPLARLLMYMILYHLGESTNIRFDSTKTYLKETYKAVHSFDSSLFARYLRRLNT